MMVSTRVAAYPLCLMLGVAAPAWAQTAPATQAPPAPDRANAGQLGENPSSDPETNSATKDIIVTGSRISRRDYVSESPIVTVGAAALQSTGSPNLEQTLNTLPQLAASASASANFSPRGGQANADLRGLGQQRTLVLLDGKRMQPSSSDGTIDLNTIPPALIESAEVITGGASAVYGSDAVTGVVNLKLRTNVRGVELTGQRGISSYGDGGTTDLNLIAGTKLADGRVRIVGDVAYSKRDPVGFTDRSYLTNQATSANQPEGRINADATNLPNQAVITGIFQRYGVAGTVSRSSAFGFNNDGSLFLAAGPVNYRGSGLPYVGVYAGQLTTFAGNYFYAQTPMERVSSFGRVDVDVSDHLHVFAQGLYTNYNVTAQLAPGVVGSNTSVALSVPTTNPFIPADLARLLASRPRPGANFTITKRLIEGGVHQERYDYDVYQGQIGASGDLFGDFKWDVVGAYGRTRLKQTEIDYQSSSALNRLLQAPDGGRSLCSGGFNPFGYNPLSASCIAYVDRNPVSRTSLERGYVEANVTGTLLELPAGRLKLAAGAAYRKDSFSFSPDADAAAGDIAGFLPVSASRGSTNVKEIYLEALIPIFQNAIFAKEFNVDAAYRYSDYDSIGGVSTYKGDVDWLVRDGVRLRGGYSRATRAPSVGELFAPRQFGQAILGTIAAGQGDACDVRSAYRTGANAGQVRALCLAQGVPTSVIDTYNNINTNTTYVTSGNTALKEETADTFSVGAVLHPGVSSPLISHINFSVDYYKIKLKGAIGVINNTLAVQRCFNADGSNPGYSNASFDCGLITRDPSSGLISSIVNPTFNLGGYTTDGIDFALDWSLHADELGLGDSGRLTFNTTVSKLEHFRIQTIQTGPYLDYAGTLGNTQIDPYADAHPNWKATTSLTYALKQFEMVLRWRFIDRMQNASNVGTTVTNPPIEAVNYFDLNSTIRVNDRFQLTLGVVNLGNRKPPLVNASVAGNYYTDIYTYDLLGRRFFVTAKAKF